MKLHAILVLMFIAAAMASCDPEHKKKCEWTLMPDTDRTARVDEGFIPVCARNFSVNKQDCRLQATLDFAKEHYQKMFRYVDMKIDGPGLPRTVLEIEHCSP